MNRRFLTLLIAVAMALWFCRGAPAVDVTAEFLSTADGCDFHPTQVLTHEIGDGPIPGGFPVDELITSASVLTPQVVCVPDDGIANDWIVRITNLSPIPYRDLFFVADEGNDVGNRDGVITDLVNAPNSHNSAFRIDALGTNDNLLLESLNADEIFQPGETWEFLVTNFVSPGNAAPLFGSAGVFSGSSVGDLVSTASIVANPVPEPAGGALLATCLVLLGAVWRFRAARPAARSRGLHLHLLP